MLIMIAHGKKYRTVLKILLVILHVLLLIFSSSVSEAQVLISGSINRAEPQNDLKDAYTPSDKIGYGFDLGYRINFYQMGYSWDEIRLLLNYTRNYFQFRRSISVKSSFNPEDDAKIDKTCAGWQTGLYLAKTGDFWISIFYGSKYGASRLLTDDKLFGAADDDINTDLEDMSGEYRYSKIMNQGIEIAYLNTVMLNYSFDLESIDKDFIFTHAAANALLVRGGSYLPYFAIRYFMIKNKKLRPAFRVFSILYASAVQFLWFKLDYKYHNWPFKDVRPLHYFRQSLSFSYNFKL